MRDFVVLTIILGSVPIAFFNPYYGVLIWYWIAYFNPHRQSWNLAYFPVAQVIAAPTLAGLLLRRVKINRGIWTSEVVLMFVLLIWYGVTLLHAMQIPAFAGHIASAEVKLVTIVKILLMTFVTILLVTTKERLRTLMIVVAFSFGVLALKSAIWGSARAGESRVWGPENSFIGDNNAFALALDMSLPFFFFLASGEERRWLRWVFRLFFFSGILCVILTYSRGGMLGLITVLLAITVKSRRVIIGSALLGIAAFLLLTFAPGKWMNRMGQFAHGNLDESANERLFTWQTGWNIVKDYPIFGGGFDVYPDLPVYQYYAPKNQHPVFFTPTFSSGPHSVYMQTLGEHGFVGFGIYLFLLGGSMVSLQRLLRIARRNPSARWVVQYSHMLQVSLLAFAVSGAFLEFANFDFYYEVIASVAIIKILYRKQLASEYATAASHELRAGVELAGQLV